MKIDENMYRKMLSLKDDEGSYSIAEEKHSAMQATLIHSRTKHQKKYLNVQIIKEKSHTKLFKSLYLLFTSLLGHTLNKRQRVSRMEHVKPSNI